MIVQQQALKDHAQAMANFFNGTHRRPSWRKAGRDEGLRIVHLKSGDIRRLNRHNGEVRVPNAGWVRFRWSRAVPDGVKSYRVTRDAGRWHIGFAVIPDPVPGPRTGEAVGIDRGVAVRAALSTGQRLTVPGLTAPERQRLLRLQRKLTRARRGSAGAGRLRRRSRRLKAREADRRTDWTEKVVYRSGPQIRRDPRRESQHQEHDALGERHCRCARPQRPGQSRTQPRHPRQRLGPACPPPGGQAPGRVEKIHPAYTSQCCSACGQIAAESRKSQALFACVACGFACNADVNAARNIAAGHAVTARGGCSLEQAREPRTAAPSPPREQLESPPSGGRRMSKSPEGS